MSHRDRGLAGGRLGKRRLLRATAVILASCGHAESSCAHQRGRRGELIAETPAQMPRSSPQHRVPDRSPVPRPTLSHSLNYAHRYHRAAAGDRTRLAKRYGNSTASRRSQNQPPVRATATMFELKMPNLNPMCAIFGRTLPSHSHLSIAADTLLAARSVMAAVAANRPLPAGR